jgi:hypothetical protein
MTGWRSVGRRMQAVAVIAVFLLVAFYLSGCLSSNMAEVTPTPTKTPRPLDVALLPTNTPTPFVPPTLTPTPTAAVTDTATPTPEPTQPVTPTVTPWPTFGPDTCPLTGLQVSDPALLQRRPLAIKIQNASLSRPQYGLPQADIVYEHLSEAAITRFTGIYLCQDVDKIGSVRSARFIDLEIPAMYKSLMAFSGTSPGLYPKFKEADFRDREFWYDQGIHSEAFYRDKELRAQGLPIEHTLFALPDKVWEIADKLGINQPQDLQGMTFAYDTPSGGQPGVSINIPYPSRDMVVDYRYDAKTGTYLRWQGGEPFLDALSGQQISVTNVVLVYANHVDADFYEDYPRTNHPSVQIQVWGTGPALIFRDGQAFEGLWARPNRDDMLVFRDKAGQVPIPLKPGNTWIQLIPLPGHRWSFEASWKGEE